MFEAFVFICMLKDPTNCQTLADIEGPYKTEKQCVARAYEIAVELPDWMPEYIAVRYKCSTEQDKMNINHDTEKKRQFKGVLHKEWRQETH